MKLNTLALGAAVLALAACGQPAEAPEAAAPAAQSRIEQLQSMDQAQELVGVYQDFMDYMEAHPELTPPCQNVRGTEKLGIVPDTVAADGIYAGHVGAVAYTVQCGELRTLAPMEPRERWLVLYTTAAPAPAVLNCADENGIDRCRPLAPPAP